MANMELITSVIVGSGGAASVTLPATGTIPQTYTDLKVVVSSRTDGTSQIRDYFLIRFNSSTSGYSRRWLYGYDSNGTGSGSATSESYGFAGTTNGPDSTASTFGNAEIYIPNYTNTSINKSYSVDAVAENNSTTTWMVNMTAGLWSNTAAITSITLYPAGGNVSSPSGKFLEHSTFYLYGVSNVTSGSKATGGVVSSDGTYWYHMFPFSSTFTPTQSLTVDYLVVAGGGGGAAQHSGGGGGGGYRTSLGGTALSLTAQAYTVTVGAGGAPSQFGTNPITTNGNNGSNSVFSSITASGGGGGGRYQSVAGNAGGSGGGGGPDSAVGGSGNAGSYTPVEGYAGGNGAAHNTGGGGGGGGGGAGGVGANAVAGGSGGAGNGGIGVQNNIDGNNYYWAGGGGGATIQTGSAGAGDGGLGGGGGGGAAQGGTFGTGGGSAINSGVNGSSSAGNIGATGGAGGANTGGGGGGGGSYESSAGAGGSGIVIIRYAI